ncbi:MAG: 3-hydroxyacyl-CoA dehydrogenase [Acidimicrobiia bacterium]|nr:3-hydroxyacyl-CoA dehydrogenase [Acidimicrobiia bacterium]
MKLEGSVVFITGGASGLGAASARMVVDAGGRAALADRNWDLGQAVAASLGSHAIFVETDVTDAESVGRAMADTAARLGRLDVAMNCAGVGSAQRILGKDGPMSLESFRKVVEVNLIGSFNMSRLAAASMAQNAPGEDGERGVIIHTASIAAFDGQIGQCAYSASKGGVVGMTLPMARDLARHGIRVVTIAPGLFDTPLLAGLPEEARRSLEASIPYPARLGSPAEYAQLARHIIENRYLNGEVIRLDGALRMGPR